MKLVKCTGCGRLLCEDEIAFHDDETDVYLCKECAMIVKRLLEKMHTLGPAEKLLGK